MGLGIVERRLQTQLESNQQTVRAIADTLETAAGAGVAGFVSGHMGDKGMKIAAFGGAIVTVTGALMDQPDIASFGRGAMAGGIALYFQELGKKAKAESEKPANQAPPAPRQEETSRVAERMEAEHPSDDRDWDELTKRRRERELARGRG